MAHQERLCVQRGLKWLEKAFPNDVCWPCCFYWFSRTRLLQDSNLPAKNSRTAIGTRKEPIPQTMVRNMLVSSGTRGFMVMGSFLIAIKKVRFTIHAESYRRSSGCSQLAPPPTHGCAGLIDPFVIVLILGRPGRHVDSNASLAAEIDRDVLRTSTG